MIIELSENDVKALEFVAKEELRNQEIKELEIKLRNIQKRLKELNANIQYGYGGNWYDVFSIEPSDTRYSGYVNEIRIKKNINTFSI